MTFTLAARSPSAITSVTLLIQTSKDARIQVAEAAFTPGRAVAATVRRDLKSQPIRPFSQVKYWWRVADAGGHAVTTEAASLTYEDNRFAWRTAQRDRVIAHWYAGDLAFGQSAADIGALALARINRDLGAPPPPVVNVYIYESVSDLQAGLQLAGRTWVGGHADPDLGVVVIAVAPGQEAVLGLERGVPHELTHILIFQATGANYAAIPFWLNEGLAVSNESQPNPTYRIVLQQADGAGTLLPLKALCGAFPLDAAEATLAYAESESVVRYLRDRWGSAKVIELLAAYADGSTCEGGVQRALKTTLAGLQSDWARDVLQADPLQTVIRGFAPWLLLMLLPFAALLGLLHIPRRAIKDSG